MITPTQYQQMANMLAITFDHRNNVHETLDDIYEIAEDNYSQPTIVEIRYDDGELLRETNTLIDLSQENQRQLDRIVAAMQKHVEKYADMEVELWIATYTICLPLLFVLSSRRAGYPIDNEWVREYGCDLLITGNSATS